MKPEWGRVNFYTGQNSTYNQPLMPYTYDNKCLCIIKNLEVDGCPSKQNLFGPSALFMNATYIVFHWGNP